MMSLHVATRVIRGRGVTRAVASSLQLIRGLGKNPGDEEDKDETLVTEPPKNPKEGNKDDIKSLLSQFRKKSATKQSRLQIRRGAVGNMATASSNLPGEVKKSQVHITTEEERSNIDLNPLLALFKPDKSGSAADKQTQTNDQMDAAKQEQLSEEDQRESSARVVSLLSQFKPGETERGFQ